MPQPKIYIKGRAKLRGQVTVHGAKNSALKLLAASILAPVPVKLTNVPRITDIEVMIEVLQALGASVQFSPEDEHTLLIDTASVRDVPAPYELVNKMRASITVLGPLLARFGRAEISKPGGCQIGVRSVDSHLVGPIALGAEIDLQHGNIVAQAPLCSQNGESGLVGAVIQLPNPSVGATETAILSATTAKGQSIIKDAAREPEIVDLCNFLRKLGYKISGDGSSEITVEGVQIQNGLLPPDQVRGRNDINDTSEIVIEGTMSLRGAPERCDEAIHNELDPDSYLVHQVIGDRIEACTYLLAGLLCSGPVTAVGIDPLYLGSALDTLRDMGAEIRVDGAGDEASITVSNPSGIICPVDLTTAPFPQFATDLQPLFMVALSLANGESTVSENLFENRYMAAEEIERMGANISIEGHIAHVTGVAQLQGAEVHARDLRAGAALVLAGLAAQGETVISGTEYIARGYENIVGGMAGLGADIEIF